MAQKIEDLLHRRTDLSTFFVHFTQGIDLGSAQESILKIVKDKEIMALSNFGMAKNLANTYSEALKEASLEQKVCCFTETPLEHCWMMVEDIEHRDCEFKPYGIVFSKDFGMKQGLNPVWYLNTTPRTDHLTVPINHMVESCREELDTGRPIEMRRREYRDEPKSIRFEILRTTPFMEQVGATTFGRKDFSWEREWRKVGGFKFDPGDVVAVLAPEDRHGVVRQKIEGTNEEWKRRAVPLLDPKWGLERMVLTLSGSKL